MTRYTKGTAILEGGMILVAALFAVPIWVLVNLSLKPPDDLSSPLAPARHPTLDNYSQVWTEAGLGSALVSSTFVTVASVTIIVILSVLAAYPLARSTARWSRLAFGGFMIGLLLPFQLALIPLYATMRDLGLLGSRWSLVLFYSGLQLPFSIFLYVSFLRALPIEYEEAAVLDGARPFQMLRQIVFPLLRPVTGTLVILNAIAIWNDFLTPNLYLSGSENQTVPVTLYTYVGQYTAQWQLVFAGLVIAIIPVLACYFLMQRHIIRGFAGGLKG
jgi:raffinose/stachyose/melibiose transport system permease protein